jgi:excisionase family DNA binding protein
MPADIMTWPDIADAAVQTGLSEADLRRLVREKKLKKRTRRMGGVAVDVIDPQTLSGFMSGGQVVRATQVVPARSGIARGMENAFLEFLQAPRQTEVGVAPVVPIERRLFLTLAESAQLSGLPVGFLKKLMADGSVKSVKTGAGWRIPRTELERLPDLLTQTPPVKEELSEAEERDLAMNKLRRQGLLPPS